MNVFSKNPKTLLLLATLVGPASVSFAQQPQDLPGADPVTVYGSAPPEAAEMTKGPDVEGIISARTGNSVQVTTANGANTVIAINDATRIKASGGFLGLSRSKLAADSLLNGLPVSVETLQGGGRLVASEIDLKNKDLKTASMIRNGTQQRFGEQGAAIAQNAAATEALRGRMGDIDQYNVKSTTNVNFDTGKAALSAQAKNDLCATAAQAQGMDNALLLVVGYTDSTGSQEFNQRLSEKRAGSVVNYLQQACGWKPYRMLTPTGMAEADPAASNDTVDGKAQNRRVAVNILVSKAVDGL
ncbi:OmpA family protein [Sphingomonas changbaiensis NBRC 104936]|uniref:OmpA family protein n=1 Tax=Sphingomonas changbaiensis NBRC 104936 TaxID=1219043 RepID=A0A0E9MP99_9SPHN|nr:OmpA family protein [Sphingomonas changbaiensis]GAO39592.1 OmpA family protein [Sphingomonas changbaiensis NBRC 104936]